MNELQDQLNRAIFNALAEFNATDSLSNVRSTYKLNFEEIKKLLLLRNERNVFEDIINLDKDNKDIIMANFLLIKEVNHGIKEDKILKDDIQ
ncbi:hypothetical protein CMU40_01265 [Elizabethkingia anophelis]|nr:hypothetical protein [Elizabethkingia anophelis]MDV3728907.1 hypothetical protein [Elizabethkingia anophelis]MDV3746027.1 hypothetical protein [Elizabethkingia anophelis]